MPLDLDLWMPPQPFHLKQQQQQQTQKQKQPAQQQQQQYQQAQPLPHSQQALSNGASSNSSKSGPHYNGYIQHGQIQQLYKDRHSSSSSNTNTNTNMNMTINNNVNDTVNSSNGRAMSIDSDTTVNDSSQILTNPNARVQATNDLFASNATNNNNNNNKNKNNQSRFFFDNCIKEEQNVGNCDSKTLFQKAKSFIMPNKNQENGKRDGYAATEPSISVSADSISYNKTSPCPFGCRNCGASFDQVPALKKHLMDGHCGHSVSDRLSREHSSERVERRERSQSRSSVSRSTSTNDYVGGFDAEAFMSTNASSSTKDQYAATRRKHGKNGETKEKRFKCLLCGKAFEFRWILRRHMKVHTGEKEYPCEICGKKFRHKSNVKVHMIKHSTTAKIHCKFCGKDFKWQASYKRHKCSQNEKNKKQNQKESSK